MAVFGRSQPLAQKPKPPPGLTKKYFIDAGLAGSDLQASGACATIFSDAGTGVSDLQGYGADIYLPGGVTYIDTGGGESDLQAFGPDAPIYADAGFGESDLQSSGPDSVSFSDAGYGSSQLVGGGLDVFIQPFVHVPGGAGGEPEPWRYLPWQRDTYTPEQLRRWRRERRRAEEEEIILIESS